MRHQLGRFAPSASTAAASSSSADENVPPNLIVGARCQVALSEELQRRGTIRFVGTTEFGTRDGKTWVGVEWDEPVGKNDGMCVPPNSTDFSLRTHTILRRVDGKRYFQTQPLRASFVRPDKVTVGNFPELDPFAEEDEEM